jgi:hypothetical protein
MALNPRIRSILSWVLTIGGGIGLGAVAARFHLLDQTAVLFGLVVVAWGIVGLGIWGMVGLSRPWTDDD